MENFSPFVGILSAIVMWGGFLIALAIMRNFIEHGISIAIAELLLKSRNDALIEKVTRWFGNGDVIADYLEEINNKIKP